MDFEDLENEIPVNNIRLSHGSTELRVRILKKNEEGYTETRIERHKAQQEAKKQICITRPFNRFQPVSNTICSSVEDVKEAASLPNKCWRVYDCIFRRVLVYGKVVVLNQFSRDDKTCFKFSVDDGSQIIIATMNITKEAKRAVSNQAARLTVERNKVRKMHEIGVNVKGTFYPPESQECQNILGSVSSLHHVMMRNVRNQKKEFHLGPIREKALIMASLYLNNDNEVQLYIIDISLDDKIELAWKRQLNKLYLKEYLKQPQT